MLLDQKKIDQSILTIERCCETLNTIADTCCSAERSPNMIDSQNLLNEVFKNTKDINYNSNNINLCIKNIGTIGNQLGFLYVTCCTEVRIPLYQKLFTDLMQVHSIMYLLLGHSH